MALTRNEIIELYTATFNRAADADGVAYWETQTHMTQTEMANSFVISAEAAALYPASQTDSEYITAIYTNLFNRAPDAAGLAYWVADLAAGVPRENMIVSVVNGALGSDQTILDNKTAVSTYYADSGLNGTDFLLNTVTNFPATVTAAKANVDAVNPSIGETFSLTKGVDTKVGGTANDTFNANFDPEAAAGTGLHTLGGLDVLDGGTGTDTLAITNDDGTAYTMAQATISNIENITIKADDDITAVVNGSNITGLKSISTTKSVDSSITAGATTNISVSGATGQTTTIGGQDVTVTQILTAAATSGIQVNSAKNVTITATGSEATAAGINVGAAAGTAATGTVSITATGAAVLGNDGATALDAITVYGGTSVNITQVATSSYGDSASTNAGGDDIITQGAIGVNTTNSTTDITITQDAAVTAVNAANTTGGVTETASVKFSALTAGQTIILGGLTMTADVAMTANEAAAAFANLAADAAKGTLLAGDTQSAGVYTKATYTGNFSGWTSGAATGDTVVFTSTTANTNTADLAETGTGTAVVTTTAGKAHDATMAGGVTGIVAGTVTIAAGTTATALTTVTVDSYGAGSAITGTAAALATINLSNGAAFTVSDTADTVTLNLENTTGAVTFTAQPTTLTVNSIGNNTGGVIAAATTETLNVKGTGLLTSAGSLAAVKTITVTETAGLNLSGATLTALESVNTTGTTGTVTVSIVGAQATYTGGAGVDNVTVSDATSGVAIAKAIDLGAGNDKLTLSGILAKVPAVELKGGEGTDTVSLVASSAITTALSADLLFAAKVTGFERLEITGATGTQAVNVANLGLANYVTVAGVAAAGTLTLNDLANNATVVLNATNTTGGLITNIKNAGDVVLGTADVLNLEITNEATIAAGTVTAANIETVNLTVTDVFLDSGAGADTNDATHTMTFKATTATTLTVDGTAGLTLTLDAATVKLTTINASGMTEGGLTVTADGNNVMTITGGAGADVLTASATKADVLNGGDGADTLTAGFNGAKLTGGAGNDLFVVGADSAVGNTESNTYSYIKDFTAGDKIQLAFWDTDATGGPAAPSITAVDTLTKLAASLDEGTASFSNFVTATFAEMTTAGDAVWFMYGGHSYIVIDNNVDAGSAYVAQAGFVAGEDLIVRVENVDLTGVSFNSDYGTIEIA